MRLRRPKSRFLSLMLLGACLCLPLSAESVLRFPRLTNQNGTLLGVTFVNPTDSAASLELVAYDTTGLPLGGAGITNPAELMVPANQQLGVLAVDIFGAALAPETVAWFQATSPVDGITGFYLFLDAAGTFLDGADLPRAETRVVFNRVKVDSAGGVSTELNIVNTDDLVAQIDLFLMDEEFLEDEDPDNDMLQVRLDNVPGRAVRRVDVATLFNLDLVGPSAYIVASSDTRILGFEIVREAGKDAVGLNARTAPEGFNRLYFPQLAVLGQFQMEIGVVNRALHPVNATFTAFRPDGQPYSAPQVAGNRVVREIPAGFPFHANVEELFGFVGEETLDGWIQVETEGEDLNGYVSYGIPDSGADAAVAAPSAPQTEALIAHIASTSGFFTGVAALNPAAVAASFRIVALTAAGQILGSFDGVLGPGERISRLIDQYIPEAAGQSGGIIWIRSNSPLYLTALFGRSSLRVLSNIPAQDVVPSYRPDGALPGLELTPGLAVLEPSEGVQFTPAVVNGPAELTWVVDTPGGGSIDENGLFTAPGAAFPAPVTVQAEDPLLGIRAAATVDILDRTPFGTPLVDVQALAYSPLSDSVFAALPAAVPAGVVGVTRVVQITDQGIDELTTLPLPEIRALIPFQSFDGIEFLLAAGGDEVLRLDLDTLEIRVIEAGFSGIRGMAYDRRNGNLMVADGAGLSLIAGSQIEPDRVSQLESNGSATLRVLAQAGIGDVAFDPCSADFYFSRPESGQIFLFQLGNPEPEMISDGLEGAEHLLLLHRRDQSCRQSGHLLAGSDGGTMVSLIPLSIRESQDWLPVTSAGSMIFIPSQSVLVETDTVVLAERGAIQQAGLVVGDLVAVEVPSLYQAGPVNPGPVPSRGIYSDPVGDTFATFESVRDAVEFSVTLDGSELILSLTLAGPLVPCGQSCPPDGLRGFIELDLDQDVNSGGVTFIDRQVPFTTGLGVEFCVVLETYDPGSGTIEAYRVVNNEAQLAGRVEMEITSHSATVRLPLFLLDDDGLVNAAVVLGSPLEATDTVPNGGFVSSLIVNSGN